MILNHVADFLQLHLLQKVLFWWQDLSQSITTSSSECSILVTRSFSIMWRIFYSYIFFKRFYFGDKIFLNHVADFLQLHLLQNVLFWWQASYPPFWELIKLSSSRGSILMTRSFSIIWRIFYNYIFFKRFNFCDKIFLNHVADFLQLHLPQNVLFWWQASYPPFWELIKLSTILGIWSELSTILGIWAKVIHQFRNLERVIHHFGNLSKGYPPVWESTSRLTKRWIQLRKRWMPLRKDLNFKDKTSKN